jgi:DNA-binding transcriptional ArsR family regulator
VLKYSDEVDAVFAALADPTRRAIVERLGRGPASVSELAQPLPMSLPAVVQHLQVLEGCGVVRTEKVGRVRTCRLEVTPLATVQDWIEARRRTWESRLDRLGAFLAEQPEAPGPTSHPSSDPSTTTDSPTTADPRGDHR